MTTVFEPHRIVEYIKMEGVEFDAADIDEDLAGVLANYGVVAHGDALEALRQELLPLGLQRELAEMARLEAERRKVWGLLEVGA